VHNIAISIPSACAAATMRGGDAFPNLVETTLTELHEENARRGSGTASPAGDAAVLRNSIRSSSARP
jgi:hypothetical protein